MRSKAQLDILEQVINFKGHLQPYGILGDWTRLTPDDAPLLVGNVGNEEFTHSIGM